MWSPITVFTVSIWSDWPAGPQHPFSTPRELLWSRDFFAGQFIQQPQPEDWQGWFDPSSGGYILDNHFLWDQINIDSIPDPFIQLQDSIYWLEIDFWDLPFIGWKETDQNWNDDGVFWWGADWIELRDPITGGSIDLAFVITSQVDFGDAPDRPYPTILASDGARHSIVPGIFLGTSIDAELDGQPSGDALGDDNDGNDDEDGVVFLSLVYPDSLVNVKVTASVPGSLDAWVDFNGDGDWTDAGEKVFSGTALAAGANFLTFTVPSGATVGTTYSRFRFTLGGISDPTGLAPNGEVEDYRVFIQEPIEDSKMHWPQWPDLDSTGIDIELTYAQWAELADDWLCVDSGPVTDIHFWGSFKNDLLPPWGPDSMEFELSIYSNDGGDPGRPGQVLWDSTFLPGEYEVHLKTDNNPEDFHDAAFGGWWNDNHLETYQFDFYIDTADALVQDSGTIYWLSVVDLETRVHEPPYEFGWKTTRVDLRWGEDAVYFHTVMPGWFHITYPVGHEYYSPPDTTLDLAFVITGGAECPCGDCNNDGRITFADALYLKNYYYQTPPGSPPPICDGDVNLDGRVTFADALYIKNYYYQTPPGSPPPCQPPKTSPLMERRMER
jgi:hypothetical protein